MPEIRDVVFSPEVEDKLFHAHGLTIWTVVAALLGPDSEARWDVDPAHGGRVVVRARTLEPRPRWIFAALRPLDVSGGVWSCITAYVVQRTEREDEI